MQEVIGSTPLCSTTSQGKGSRYDSGFFRFVVFCRLQQFSAKNAVNDVKMPHNTGTKKTETMATFSHEVSPYRRRDGTYLIKIRMIHNGTTLRKPSGVYARSDQLTRDRKRLRDPALIDAVNRHVDRIRMAAAGVDGAMWMDAGALWSRISAAMESEKGFRLDFAAFAGTLTSNMEKGTAEGYKWAVRALQHFLGRDSVDVNEIDRAMVLGFREWLEAKNGKGCRSASAYLEKLRTIHGRARDLYNDPDTGLVRIPREPFKGAIPPQPSTAHRALSVDQLRMVLSSEPATKRGRMAKDVFQISFCLAGINTVDIYRLQRGDLRGGVLTYNRAKTDSVRPDQALMIVRVEPEAAEVMERWKGSKALMSFADRYCDFRGFNKAVNVGLKEVGRLAGVPGLTTLHARHSWATVARNVCGIPKDTVAESLNHAGRGSERVTDIYLERDFSRVWDANRKVLDLVFGC